MKIDALALDYPPYRYIGAELFLHRFLKALQGPEDVITVRTHPQHRRDRFDGISIVPDKLTPRPAVDVAITNTGLAKVTRLRYPKTPLVVLGHNNQIVSLLDIREARPDLLIANTHHMAEVFLSVFGQDSIVVHPPVPMPEPRAVPEGSRRYLTLVNTVKEKGSDVVWALAAAHPEWEFLGVQGGYGVQTNPHLANVTISPHRPDMDSIWDETKILLLPSLTESYSMTAVEASLKGIPTIAIDRPGVREALGDNAIYRKTRDPADWAQAIEFVLAPDHYDYLSRHVRVNATMARIAHELELQAAVTLIRDMQ